MTVDTDCDDPPAHVVVAVPVPDPARHENVPDAPKDKTCGPTTGQLTLVLVKATVACTGARPTELETVIVPAIEQAYGRGEPVEADADTAVPHTATLGRIASSMKMREDRTDTPRLGRDALEGPWTVGGRPIGVNGVEVDQIRSSARADCFMISRALGL